MLATARTIISLRDELRKELSTLGPVSSSQPMKGGEQLEVKCNRPTSLAEVQERITRALITCLYEIDTKHVEPPHCVVITFAAHDGWIRAILAPEKLEVRYGFTPLLE